MELADAGTDQPRDWNAVPDEIPDKRYGQVSQEQQARYLPMAYERIQQEWPWLGVANTWFLKRATDAWEQNGQPEAYFRLLTPDFMPLPVYGSLKDYVANLQPTLFPGYHQEEHWALRYSGAWETISDDQAVLGHLRVTSDPNASLAFEFSGSDLTLVAPRGPQLGRWIAEVDGRELDRLSLQASTAQPAKRLTVVRGLSSQEPHTVVLRPDLASGGQLTGPVALDGLIIGKRNMLLVNGLYCLVSLAFFLVMGFVGYLWLMSRRGIPQQAGWQD